MALRGKKPTNIKKRLKALFYGAAGVGKTTAAISFPKPYLIDTEKGAENDQYVKKLNESGGVIFQTSDFDEIIIEIKSLLTEKHDYKTLIIDPLTIIYNDLLEKASKKVGEEYAKHYVEANKRIKHLFALLTRLDMNVIITSHAKNEYGEGMKVLGQTYDLYKKSDYFFDLVFEIQKRGKERVGIVKKSRIDEFEELEQFPFSYQTIAEKYGKEMIEKDSVAQKLASEEQVAEMKRLIELLKVPEDIQEKWLDKSKAQTFEEVNNDDIQKYIDYLKSKITGENK